MGKGGPNIVSKKERFSRRSISSYFQEHNIYNEIVKSSFSFCGFWIMKVKTLLDQIYNRYTTVLTKYFISVKIRVNNENLWILLYPNNILTMLFLRLFCQFQRSLAPRTTNYRVSEILIWAWPIIKLKLQTFVVRRPAFWTFSGRH